MAGSNLSRVPPNTNSDTQHGSFPPVRSLEAALSASGVLTLLLAGAVANAAALALTCRNGTQSKLHSIFVGNLALADLSLTLLTPAAWYFYAWPDSGPAAKWTEAAIQAVQSASVCAVIAVTLDRTCLVFRPIKYRLSHRRLAPLLLAGLIWLLCAAAQAPRLCLPPNTAGLFQRLHVIAEFVAALCALACCNFTICRQIERSRKLKFLRRHSGFSTTAAGELDERGGCGGGGGSTRQLLLTAGAAGCGAAGSRKGSVPAAAVAMVADLPIEALPRRNTLPALARGPDARLSLQSVQRLSLDANCRRYARQRDSEEVINEILAKQHRRALRTLVMLVLLFALCRAPRAALACVDWAGVLSCEALRRCSFYLELLVHLNSVLDPFAYVFCGNRVCHTATRAGCRAAGAQAGACCARLRRATCLRCRCHRHSAASGGGSGLDF